MGSGTRQESRTRPAAVTGIYKHLLAYVDIESGELGAVIEDMIERAFKEGYRHGANPREPGEDAHGKYHDWRGWGPGATMPGGNAYRQAALLDTGVTADQLKAIAADIDSRSGNPLLRPIRGHIADCPKGPDRCIECANDVLDAIE